MASRGLLVFGGTCLLAAATVYYVHLTESETRLRMKQGPKRDRERLDAQTSRLFENAMEQWKDDREQSGAAGRA
ncbi:hypothetical protein GPECTOR_22g840 [Gonium pectorale]|uniref:Uncharacterized protein n=1 Tax=Gonium pectorale TaxID=33097 RepID=A0A150GHC8_GONPE|nr:hypothetical protein GPECTOR_22g840 [Gonium pectorale]|eukprot:KXZ49248.1 hypothetical protein GPECTOR_22g840 [Gonium pectorale]